jgi:hypothetical protein
VRACAGTVRTLRVAELTLAHVEARPRARSEVQLAAAVQRLHRWGHTCWACGVESEAEGGQDLPALQQPLLHWYLHQKCSQKRVMPMSAS